MNRSAMENVMVSGTDPDAILDGWNALLATGEHLHAPDFARLLGVSEAALVSSRIGQGATRLRADAAAILHDIANWGRVLCAFSTPYGVLMPLGITRISLTGQNQLNLSGDHMTAKIDGNAIAEILLFEEHTANHGKTRSLQFYDQAGIPVVKVFIFHKSRYREALKRLEHFRHPDQRRQAFPINCQPAFDPQSGPQPAVTDVEDIPKGGTEKLLTAFLSRHAKTGLTIEATGQHARVNWHGQLSGSRFQNDMLHVHEPDIRAHLRLSPLTQVKHGLDGSLIFEGPAAFAEPGRVIRVLRFTPGA